MCWSSVARWRCSRRRRAFVVRSQVPGVVIVRVGKVRWLELADARRRAYAAGRMPLFSITQRR
jgi:hypothetical protein